MLEELTLLCFSGPFLCKLIVCTKEQLESWLPPPGSFLVIPDGTNDWHLPVVPVLFFFLSSQIGRQNDWHPEQSDIPSASVFLFFIKALQTNEGTISITSPLFFFCCCSTHNDTWRKEPSSCPITYQINN